VRLHASAEGMDSCCAWAAVAAVAWRHGCQVRPLRSALVTDDWNDLKRAGLRKRLCPVAPAGAAAGGAAANYASHAAVSMALGFLFLGGGGRTFGTDDASVAALVVALFPRFPMSPTDQRCHLQV